MSSRSKFASSGNVARYTAVVMLMGMYLTVGMFYSSHSPPALPKLSDAASDAHVMLEKELSEHLQRTKAAAEAASNRRDAFIELPSIAIQKLQMGSLGNDVISSLETNRNSQRDVSDTVSSNGKSQTVHVTEDSLRTLLQRSSSCDLLSTALTNVTYLTSGWTKDVYTALLNGRPVAVKLAAGEGHDIRRCQQQQQPGFSSSSSSSYDTCFAAAERKLLKEIALLNILRQENVVELLHYCVPTNQSIGGSTRPPIVIVTELGEDVDVIRLLQMSWEDRLRVVHGLTRLLAYLSQVPGGVSVSLNDFRRRQFVLVGGELKLSDVDDAGFGDRPCDSSADCDQHLTTANITIQGECVQSQCHRYNEKKNIFWASTHFVSFLLGHGAPDDLRHLVTELTDTYGNGSLSAADLLALSQHLVHQYGNEQLQPPHHTDAAIEYVRHTNADVPGLHDYRCRHSVSGDVCTVSVVSKQQAERLCDEEPLCRAFVLSHERTWTGRFLAYLKSNVTGISQNNQTSFYVRPHD